MRDDYPPAVHVRFWSKVQTGGADECWPWTATLKSHGYGSFWLDGKNQRAHRVAYILAVGPIPEGRDIDHVRARGCTSRLCCNPAHLEPVTRGENVRRGDAGKVNNVQARKTHCPHGHAYDEENTIIDRWNGQRRCRACRSAMRRSRPLAA